MRKPVTITVRLTTNDEKALRRVMLAMGVSRSEAMRGALADKAEKIARLETMSAHERMKHLIPPKNGGGGRRSFDTGRQFLDILEEKRRGRRPG